MRYLHLPRLGQIMEQGSVLTWHVAEGDTFHIGDPLYEVETEKSTVEVEAKFDGVLAQVLVPEGDEVPVGTVLAVCWEIGETPDPQALEEAVLQTRAREAQAASPAPKAETARAAAPAAPSAAPRQKPRATPRAKRLAAQKDISLERLQGSGPDGLITESDVERAAAAELPGRVPGQAIEQTSVQRAVAQAMQKSWSDVPQFVQTLHCDATRLLAIHRRLKESGQDISLTALILYLAGRVIPDHPLVNAEYRADGVFAYSAVNVALAIDTPKGLVTPVVRNAQTLSLDEVAAALQDLAARGRAGKLTPDDFAEATITLSNLGMMGVEWGTPLINPPQSAIIFVGAVRERVVLADGGPVARPELALSMAYDHRVVDGATGARFSAALCQALSDPGALLEEQL